MGGGLGDGACIDLGAAIVEGLSAYRHDASVRDRVKTVIDARDDPTLHEGFLRHFGN